MKNKNDKEMTQEELLEYALTSNPDILIVGEIKSAEAFSAQESARTRPKHEVLTTFHKGYGTKESKERMKTYFDKKL